MMDGIHLEPEFALNVMRQRIAMDAVRIVELEAAVQQQQAEIDRLGMLVPTDKEVKDDGLS